MSSPATLAHPSERSQLSWTSDAWSRTALLNATTVDKSHFQEVHDKRYEDNLKKSRAAYKKDFTQYYAPASATVAAAAYNSYDAMETVAAAYNSTRQRHLPSVWAYPPRPDVQLTSVPAHQPYRMPTAQNTDYFTYANVDTPSAFMTTFDVRSLPTSLPTTTSLPTNVSLRADVSLPT